MRSVFTLLNAPVLGCHPTQQPDGYFLVVDEASVS
jgi:hypothetical protein